MNGDEKTDHHNTGSTDARGTELLPGFRRAPEANVRTSIEKGIIKLVHGNHTYEIEARRLRTRAGLVAWTHHLLGKAWMDAYSLKLFIETVADYRGIKIYTKEDA